MKKILFLFFVFFINSSFADKPFCAYIDWTSLPDPDPQWTAASIQQYKSMCGTRVFYQDGIYVSCAQECSCPSGSSLYKDLNTGYSSCVSNSSSSSSVYSIASSSASSCGSDQVFDTVYSFCRPKVLDPSQCGVGGYAIKAGSAYWCAGTDYAGNPPPNGVSCDLTTVSGFSGSFWVCDTPSSAASAASAASAPSSSGPASSSPSSSSNTSNRDVAPTSSTELCELNFGVGNCAPIASNTPCPSSYTANGQRFCVTPSGSTSSAVSSEGSGSGSGTSAGNNSATANNCSTQPTCTGDDPVQCAILNQSWINFCDGAENKTDINADSDNAEIEASFNDLVNQNKTDLNDDGTIKNVHFEKDVSEYADLISGLNSAASGASSGSCPSPRSIHMSIGTFELSYQVFCDLADSISYLVLLSFSIFGSLIIYRTLEKI